MQYAESDIKRERAGPIKMGYFTSPGDFFTGCNYWASHAGTKMWSDWREDVIAADFQKLADAGIKVLRIFPLWPDFQPINLLRGYLGNPVEYRIGEEPLCDGLVGVAGVSADAIDHFQTVAMLADQYGFKLIVGLITGWMSGRLFVPPALEGRNPLTDPVAIMWEIRFIKYFVSRFAGNTAIAAWDLGNECDCMGEVHTAEEAWNWVSRITNAIKSVDPGRPVLSGMHGLTPDGIWRIQDQAEILDVLTVHPYPLFTPYCDLDPINTMRNELHAAAESLYYRGIGGKPCLPEEMGTLGPMIACDEIGADYIRNNLFTLWAHDCRGFLWWCANEQSHLTHAPYDWKAFESELGFFRLDGTAKPVLHEISRFTTFQKGFPYERLPERMMDGVCILSAGQDTWGVAYSTFLLAKQAGLDIDFQYATQPIKDSGLYLLPSMKGAACISRHRMDELLVKVENGASLYISIDTGMLSGFNAITGVRVNTREKCAVQHIATIRHAPGITELPLPGAYRLNVELTHAKALGFFEDGIPAFTVACCGRGKVYFLNAALEIGLSSMPQSFHGKNGLPYWLIYRHLSDGIGSGKVVSTELANIGITEHCVNDSTRIIIVINYEPEPQVAVLKIEQEWEVRDHLYGERTAVQFLADGTRVSLEKNEAAVFTISRNENT